MAKKSTCSPNMTYVLCLVIVGLIVYLLYTNYKESFDTEKIEKIDKQIKGLESIKKELIKEAVEEKKEEQAVKNKKGPLRII
jgi:uncharacterized membrane protein (DUF106 family)